MKGWRKSASISIVLKQINSVNVELFIMVDKGILSPKSKTLHVDENIPFYLPNHLPGSHTNFYAEAF